MPIDKNNRYYQSLALALSLVFIFLLCFVWMYWPRVRNWGPAFLTILYSGPAQHEVQGTPRSIPGDGDVLLIVDDARIAESAQFQSFEALQWSYAWINYLEQEVGGNYAVLNWPRVPWENLRSYRLIIVSSSAASNIPTFEMLGVLREFVQSGGCLILETPNRSWNPLSGGILTEEPFNSCGGGSRGRVLCYEQMPHSPYEKSHLAENMLKKAPLFSFVHGTERLQSDTEGAGIIRDVPALWQRRMGQGTIVSLAFDFGLQLQAMQQGGPVRSWKVDEISGLVPGLVESQDLALSRDMVDNSYPFADMLEDWLADYSEGALGVWPRWWRFPYDYDGLLSITHDEENLGPEAFSKLWSLEQSEGIRSTVFNVYGSPEDGKRWDNCSGSDREFVSWGIHWYRFFPYNSLERQCAWAWKGGGDVAFSRIHYLLWGRNYAEPFRNLAHEHIAMDSSYGPNRGKGYLFGTGLPFQVLDDNGYPLGLWEWPFVAQENWAGVNREYLQMLLQESRREFHQAPVVLLHPHRWLAEPDGVEYLRHIVAVARMERHWIANFSDYWTFMEARRKAQLSSRMVGQHLQAKVYAPAAGMALLLSERASDIKINGQPALARPLRFNGETHWLVAVPQGYSSLSVSCR